MGQLMRRRDLNPGDLFEYKTVIKVSTGTCKPGELRYMRGSALHEPPEDLEEVAIPSPRGGEAGWFMGPKVLDAPVERLTVDEARARFLTKHVTAVEVAKAAALCTIAANKYPDGPFTEPCRLMNIDCFNSRVADLAREALWAQDKSLGASTRWNRAADDLYAGRLPKGWKLT